MLIAKQCAWVLQSYFQDFNFWPNFTQWLDHMGFKFHSWTDTHQICTEGILLQVLIVTCKVFLKRFWLTNPEIASKHFLKCKIVFNCLVVRSPENSLQLSFALEKSINCCFWNLWDAGLLLCYWLGGSFQG